MSAKSNTTSAENSQVVLRQHAEQQCAEELAFLAKIDDRQRPPNWKLSPWAVLQYVMGGKIDGGLVITVG